MKKLTIILPLFIGHSLNAQITLYQNANNPAEVYEKTIYDNNLNHYSKKINEQFGDDFKVKEDVMLISSNSDSIMYEFEWMAMPKELYEEQIEIEEKIDQIISIASLNFMDKDHDFDPSKPTFINFWFTNCPPCIAEIPTLNELKDFYKGKVNFVAITFDDEEKVKKLLNKFDFQLTHIVNEKEFIDGFNISGYPISFMLDSEQKLKFITNMLPVKSKENQWYEKGMNKIKQKIERFL